MLYEKCLRLSRLLQSRNPIVAEKKLYQKHSCLPVTVIPPVKKSTTSPIGGCRNFGSILGMRVLSLPLVGRVARRVGWGSARADKRATPPVLSRHRRTNHQPPHKGEVVFPPITHPPSPRTIFPIMPTVCCMPRNIARPTQSPQTRCSYRRRRVPACGNGTAIYRDYRRRTKSWWFALGRP